MRCEPVIGSPSSIITILELHVEFFLPREDKMPPTRKCTPGPNKKSAKLVRGLDGKMHCVRYGDPNMTIKKHKPSRKRSFCRRHKCSEKRDPATPGYQSCLAWDCGTRSRQPRPRKQSRANRRIKPRTKRTKTRPHIRRKPTRRVGTRKRPKTRKSARKRR
jgi:hypothetical protein